jgi:predicted RNA-binding protein YlqC (UPF0109 family)
MNTNEKAKLLIESVLHLVSDYPETIFVETISDDRGFVVHVNVDQRDMGRVIGTKGKTVEAIRTILNTIGYKEKLSIGFKLNEVVV